MKALQFKNALAPTVSAPFAATYSIAVFELNALSFISTTESGSIISLKAAPLSLLNAFSPTEVTVTPPTVSGTITELFVPAYPVKSPLSETVNSDSLA